MEKFAIHPECQKLLAVFGNQDLKQDVTEIRENNDGIVKQLTGFEQPFDGVRTEIVVPNEADGLPCFVYKPNNIAAKPAILVFFHGGGLLLGNRYFSDSTCKAISKLAGCIVVNVEYCLAPEFKFPVQIDDAVLVTKWVLENKVNIGAREDSKVGVAGDSAGGYLAASVTHEVKVDFQILVYPMVTKFGNYTSPSTQRYKDGPLVTVEGMKVVDKACIPEKLDLNHPRLNPISRPGFDVLPPALVILAEHDLLVDSGKEYAEKLTSSGVSAELRILAGATHGFFGSFVTCPTLCEEAFGKVDSFIQKIANA